MNIVGNCFLVLFAGTLAAHLSSAQSVSTNVVFAGGKWSTSIPDSTTFELRPNGALRLRPPSVHGVFFDLQPALNTAAEPQLLELTYKNRGATDENGRFESFVIYHARTNHGVFEVRVFAPPPCYTACIQRSAEEMPALKQTLSALAPVR